MGMNHRKNYSLRNDPSVSFEIEARVTQSGRSGLDGAQITSDIKGVNGGAFRVVVEFGGEFVATKENFTPEMFLHTAISIVESQLESKRYRDTLLKVHSHSGLTQTEWL